MKSFGVRFGVAVCVLALAGITASPERASACGGCFGPIGQPTVVTRHQMVVSISATQTTLWDQIEYAGEPEDFVWVLPVRGGVGVELAENAFFEAFEANTQIQLQAPPPPQACGSGGLAFARGDAAPEDDGTVVVYHQASIGPYETVTIGSEDPNALLAWLTERDYTVSDDILPTIAHYTDQGMNFAVLRLAPNAGVNQMQPVRVTMAGLNPVFPLRMVAAGASGSVGLELFVVAEGRYEAGNFANAEVDRGRLSYNWTTNAFNYDQLRLEAGATDGGRVWVTEYASNEATYNLPYYTAWDEETQEYIEISEDWGVATTGLSNPFVTRLTADLAVEFLDEDLILAASTGGVLSNFIQVTNEINRAPDPVCSDPAGGTTSTGWRSGGRGDGLCSASAPSDRTAMPLVLAFAMAGFAFVWRRARR
jgi:hypothetical protein